jgi:Tol biopolymer transport system component
MHQFSTLWECCAPKREPAPLQVVSTLDRVVRRSLAKDPDQRFQTARDLKAALAWSLEHGPPIAPAQSRRRWWIAIAAALVLGAAGGTAVMLLRPPAADERVVHLDLLPPPGAEFRLGAAGGSAISPDGRWIAFVAAIEGGDKLWVRPVDSGTARECPGTDGASFPFWSPDSLSIGFFAGGKLKRIDIEGGPPSVIGDAAQARGGAWNAEGTILFSASVAAGLQRVSASGGRPVGVMPLDFAKEENTNRWPAFLPGGKKFIFYSRSAKPHLSGIYVGSLDRPGEKTQLVETTTGGAYAPPHGQNPGYLVWLKGSTITAQPFDPATLRLSGRAVPVTGADGIFVNPGSNWASFSISGEGKLLFNNGSYRFQLTWFSREGRILSTVGHADLFAALRISPDGRQAAVSVSDATGTRDNWRLEFARGIQSPITFGSHGSVAVWSPDAATIVSSGVGLNRLFESPSNGAGAEKAILQSRVSLYLNDWSPDGRYLAYTESTPETGYDLWLLPMTGDRTPVPFLKTRFNESHGTFSPDSKWLAYVSDESGHEEVYVQSILASGPKWQVSDRGGGFPRWSRDGRELFYVAPDGKLMMASVRTLPGALEFGSPVALFRMVDPQGAFAYPYDVAPDGRILALAPTGGAGDTPSMTVIVNWEAGLKK